MTKEEDVLEELMREHLLTPEGDYVGDILEVGEPSYTQATHTPYVRVKIGVGGGRYVHCFIAGYLASMKLVYYALPKMVGERVRVRIRHKEFMGKTFLDATILEYLGK